MYKVNDKEYNENSNVNQEIKGRFVGNEVMCNVTTMVEFILQESICGTQVEPPFTEDDVENLYTDNSQEIDCVKTQIEWNENFIEETNDLIDGIEDDIKDLENDIENGITDLVSVAEMETEITNYKNSIFELKEKIKQKESEIEELEDELEELENTQEKRAEVYEWWAVTNWLGKKLKDKGECIIEDYDKCLWGRQGCGQAILLDSVISEICEDMCILEGQSNSWEKKDNEYSY